MKQWVFILLIGAVMTTYNTGNAVGSTDPRDLYDNAENMDLLSAGPEMEYPDRLGVPRKSWAGLEQQVADSLEKLGWEAVTVPYATGAVITRPTQLVERNGELYRVRLQSDLPLTLTGTFATDSPKLVAVGNQALRDLLAASDGATRVGYGAGTVETALDDLNASVDSLNASVDSLNVQAPISPTQYGAVGDGATNDAAAFTALEAAVTGRTIDLLGRQYLVSSIPAKNAYFNGSWKVGGFTRSAQLADTYLAGSPSFHAYGGQLRKLAAALADPLVQRLGIVFIGDSITWGTGTGESATADPRDGTLSDPRDYYGSPSYVNQFKRYIQRRYAPNSTPIITNWPASASGESIVEYRATHIMYPRYGDIVVTQATGGSMSITDVNNSSLVGGGQLQLASANTGVLNSHTITFPFTGTEFKLYFSCTETTATSYDLLVDGVLIGTYSMHAGASATSGTLVDGSNNNYNSHTFSYIKGKTVTIRTNRNGEAGLRTARFQAIEVEKRIIVSNQGINGSAFRVYGNYNLSGNFGDGVAVGADDSFVFVQLGTNDRIIPGANQFARGQNVIQGFAETTLGMIPATADTILMIANPASNESGSTYWLSMRDVRDTILRVAKKKSIDVIDNYSAFSDVDMNAVTSDGLHPNRLGMQIIFRNIINSLESS